ncbi:hypothetical protein TNCV_4633871 [Trichonephila clavipes]|nr:hypothetical protein TNCV_4633871 [Trichonephila clavipes]
MTQSGRPSSSTTEITTARIGEMIQNDQWVTLSEILSELGLIDRILTSQCSDARGLLATDNVCPQISPVRVDMNPYSVLSSLGCESPDAFEDPL